MEANQRATPSTDLALRLASVPGAATIEERSDGLWMSAPQIDVEAMARAMNELGFRLSTMTALAQADGETTVIYHYVRPHQAINIKTATRAGALPSLALFTRPASWCEREICDLFAVTFVGHPNPAPLLRPAQLERGFFRDPNGATTDSTEP